MAFQEVTDLSAETTIALGGVNRKTGKKNPTSVEGYYLGSRTVADKKKKSGESYIYFFQTSKGNVGVWGKTDLDRKMQTAQVGTMVRATFTNMLETPNGPMYKYKVEIDPENTIEVVGGGNSSASTTGGGFSASEEDEDTYGSDDESNDIGGSDLDDEGPGFATNTRVALSASDRKAQVEALLKGGGRKRG